MINAFQGEDHLTFQFDGTNNGAVLLTHGFPGSPKEMRPIAERLNQWGWTTRGILLPGFGPEIETLGQRTSAEWLNAVKTELNDLQNSHDIVILAGNSMGGGLSIQATAQLGADGLILFAPFWTLDHFLWKSLPILRFIIPKFRPFQFVKPDFSDPEFQKGTRNFLPNADFDDPKFREQALQLEVDTRIFYNIYQVGKSAFEHAREVQCPVLVIQGTQDELVTPRSTQKLLQRLNQNPNPLTYIEVEAPHNPLDAESLYWEKLVQAVEVFTKQVRLERQ